MALLPRAHLRKRGGSDVAGVGWSLSGTSILQRCAATLAADGFTDGVDFDEDRFCLDGAKYQGHERRWSRRFRLEGRHLR